MGQNIRNIEEQDLVCNVSDTKISIVMQYSKEKKKITTGNTDRAFHDKAFYEEGKKMTNNKWKILNHTKM